MESENISGFINTIYDDMREKLESGPQNMNPREKNEDVLLPSLKSPNLSKNVYQPRPANLDLPNYQFSMLKNQNKVFKHFDKSMQRKVLVSKMENQIKSNNFKTQSNTDEIKIEVENKQNVIKINQGQKVTIPLSKIKSKNYRDYSLMDIFENNKNQSYIPTSKNTTPKVLVNNAKYSLNNLSSKREFTLKNNNNLKTFLDKNKNNRIVDKFNMINVDKQPIESPAMMNSMAIFKKDFIVW